MESHVTPSWNFKIWLLFFFKKGKASNKNINDKIISFTVTLFSNIQLSSSNLHVQKINKPKLQQFKHQLSPSLKPISNYEFSFKKKKNSTALISWLYLAHSLSSNHRFSSSTMEFTWNRPRWYSTLISMVVLLQGLIYPLLFLGSRFRFVSKSNEIEVHSRNSSQQSHPHSRVERYGSSPLISIDQRSERATGESACTALVVVIAVRFHNNHGILPINSQFDSLLEMVHLSGGNSMRMKHIGKVFPTNILI